MSGCTSKTQVTRGMDPAELGLPTGPISGSEDQTEPFPQAPSGILSTLSLLLST